MGNTVSAAEIVASELTKSTKTDHHKDVFSSGQEIPPECPMHVKQPPKASASECPIKHDDDVNPLNMVRN